ncbi:MAG: hypothetical protein ACTSXH_04490 [Promethearchaeota archaeon]
MTLSKSINQEKFRENVVKIIKPSEFREPANITVEFLSVAFTRLIAAALFIISGIISLIVFGPGVGHHQTRYGNAIFLGGPSFFYVTGLPVLMIGIGLFIYFFFSIFKGKFSSSDHFLYFQEIRPRLPRFTEISKDKIEALRFQNNQLGPKYTWIVILAPFIVLQLLTTIPLFTAERAAPAHVLSGTFLIISILEIIDVYILVMYPQAYFEFASDEKLHEMWFAPRKLDDLMENFQALFNLSIPSNETKNQPLFTEISDTHYNLFRVILGVFLVGSTLIMIIGMVLFGSLFWWLGLIYGVILLVKARFYDFSDPQANKYFFDEQMRVFKFYRKFKNKFQYIIANNVSSAKLTKWFRRLDFFDVGLIGGMIVSLMILQVEGWKIADSMVAIRDNIISTIYMCVLIFLIFVFVCIPIDVVEFKTPTITYRIETTLRSKVKKQLSQFIEDLKNLPAMLKEPRFKKTFLLRIIIIGILLLVGLGYSLIEFDFYLF